MNVRNALITAIRALSRNKMRSALTSLGIIIGISSVIVMFGIGNSAKIAVQKMMYTAGANAISIYNSSRPLTERDIEDLKRLYPQIKYITPYIYKSYIPVKFRNRSLMSRIYGVNNDFFNMQDWEFMYGTFFNENQIIANERVVVLGSTVKTELFGDSDPKGEIILIKNTPFRVIGSLVGAGQALSGRDFDNIMIMPYTTAQTRIVGDRRFDQINLATAYADEVDEMVESVRSYFRRMHSIPYGKPDDFKIETSKDKLKKADEITSILSYLLAFIASISLVVGGIGIMNIMLVSVSERTREIGIRMAIGAKKKDVLLQFLIESVTLSTAGGAAGISIGLLIYFVIVFFVDWPFLFSAPSVVLSFVFASFVGIFFGYYPAKKASDLKPIDALRSE